MLFLQLLVVLVAIIIGARLGGIGLGVMGGVGLAILSFVFGLQPTAPPIDVMLMIAAVIAAASCMQAAGGLEYMVKVAEHILRRNPAKVTILSPIVTYLFTFIAGTGHIAYSVLPVIAEVARETKIRPERPLGIAVIASQQAITASPISAATVALLGLLAGFDISLFDILKVTVPATLIGVLVGAFCSMKVGKELEDDPEYQRRLKEGMIEEVTQESTRIENLSKYNPKNEKTVLEKRKRKVRPERRKNENGKFPDTHTKKRQRLNVNKTVFKRCFFMQKNTQKVIVNSEEICIFT